MNLKSKKVKKYWGEVHEKIDYRKIDQTILREFKGSHPKVIDNWLTKSNGLFQTDKNYSPSRKEKKHQIMNKFETLFGINLSKKHYKLV